MPDLPSSLQPFPHIKRRRSSSFRRSTSTTRAVVADVAPAPDVAPDVAPTDMTGDVDHHAMDVAPPFTPPLSPQLYQQPDVSPAQETDDENLIGDDAEKDNGGNQTNERTDEPSAHPDDAPPGIQPDFSTTPLAEQVKSPVSPQPSPSKLDDSSYEPPSPNDLSLSAPNTSAGAVFPHLSTATAPKAGPASSSSPRPKEVIARADTPASSKPVENPVAEPVAPSVSPESQPASAAQNGSSTHSPQPSSSKEKQSKQTAPQSEKETSPLKLSRKADQLDQREGPTETTEAPSAKPSFTSPDQLQSTTDTPTAAAAASKPAVADGTAGTELKTAEAGQVSGVVETHFSPGKTDWDNATPVAPEKDVHDVQMEDISEADKQPSSDPDNANLAAQVGSTVSASGVAPDASPPSGLSNEKEIKPLLLKDTPMVPTTNGNGTPGETGEAIPPIDSDDDDDVEFHFEAAAIDPLSGTGPLPSNQALEAFFPDSIQVAEPATATELPDRPVETKATAPDPPAENSDDDSGEDGFTFTAPNNPFMTPGAEISSRERSPVPMQPDALTLPTETQQGEPHQNGAAVSPEVVEAIETDNSHGGGVEPEPKSGKETLVILSPPLSLPEESDLVTVQRDIQQADDAIGLVPRSGADTRQPSQKVDDKGKSTVRISNDVDANSGKRTPALPDKPGHVTAADGMDGAVLSSGAEKDLRETDHNSTVACVRKDGAPRAEARDPDSMDLDEIVPQANARDERSPSSSYRENRSLRTKASRDQPSAQDVVLVNSSPSITGNVSDDDSEVEVVDPKRHATEVSENVKRALEALPVRDVAVVVDKFTRFVPPHPDDHAVLKAVETYARSNKSNRRRRILVLVSSNGRAQKLRTLFNKYTNLQTGMFGIGKKLTRRYKEDDRGSLDCALASTDVVVTLDRTANFDASWRRLDLRLVQLIVLDSVEHTFKRAHPTSQFMRDYHRALPEKARPRVLAIARADISIHKFPPIERNIYTRFCSSLTEAKWTSCYGRGFRPPENELLDIETLYYTPAFENRDSQNQPIPVRRGARKGDVPPLDLMEEEVGPLGVSLFQRRMASRQIAGGRSRGVSRFRDDRLPQMNDPNAILGLTEKMMKLINELYDAYRASTQVDRLLAVIFAGKAPVACAMTEVLKALPIFEHLNVSVVVGKGGAREVEDPVKDFACENVQGDETDDEEISSFVAGEVNILIVSDTYYDTEEARRPIPPCPLIIRFDGSRPTPSLEAGGCRCRVIVMRRKALLDKSSDLSHPKDQTRNESVRISNNHALPNPNPAPTPADSKHGNALQSNQMRQDGTPPSRKRPRPSPQNEDEVIVVDEAGPFLKVAKTGNSSSAIPEVPDGPLLERDFFSKAAKPLRGPSESNALCHYYRPVLFKNKSEHNNDLRDEINIGIHEFLVVFSEKLNDEDLVMSLRDIAVDSGSHTRTATGFVKLEYHGADRLSPSRLSMARKYTSILFKHVYPASVDLESKFVWDNAEEAHSEERRCYLILPATSANPSQLKETVSDLPDSSATLPRLSPHPKRNRILSMYFGSFHSHSLPKRHVGDVKVDWDQVKKLLDLQKDEHHSNEARIPNGLGPKEYSALEGRLIFSTIRREGSLLSGCLQHDVGPMTVINRSVKFALNDDGTLIPHKDLPFVVGMRATNKTIALQGKLDMSEKELSSETHHSVRWDPETKRLVKAKCAMPLSKLDLFDCDRNVMKKRKVWIGKVSYTTEHYYKSHYDRPLETLDQPLLNCSRARHFSLENLLEVINGKQLDDICSEIVQGGVDFRRVLPERVRVYPVPVGALFLPPVLYNLEQHVSACELRSLFDGIVGVKGDLAEILKSVTSACVNSKRNYERLELLGDSVLKLSSTIRLFRSGPHDSEGQMHDKRATLVSNARLNRIGKEHGVQNYLRSIPQSENSWMPPGTDIRGQVRRGSLKGLADVVEAMCGAYFLAGSRVAKEEQLSGSKDKGESSSDSMDDVEEDGIDIDSDEEEDVNATSGDNVEVIDVDAEESPHGAANGAPKLSVRRARSKKLNPAAVERGYLAGCSFLEAIRVFKKHEPSHREILLAGIHALHPVGSAPPKEITHSSFPKDSRLTHPGTPWELSLGIVEDTIDYKFKRRHLLLSALTHGSYVKKNGTSATDSESYQRLEFLGDAVADFVVVRYLYETYPELGPGDLTNLKGNVVSNESFARVSVTNGLHKFVFHNSPAVKGDIERFISTMNEQDLTRGGLGGQTELKRNLGEIAAPKILGDIFEGVVGAVFVDSGLRAAWRVCKRMLQAVLRVNANPLRDDVHPCNELLHFVRDIWKLTPNGPSYETARGVASDNGRRKVCTVSILGERIALGRGTTDKRAKLMAAKNALKLLRDPDVESRGCQLLQKLREMSVRWKVAQQRQGA